MGRLKALIGMGVATVCLISVMSTFADSTRLHPITWKGKKWEYLVEYPADTHHVDPERFEEILDTAGQHGWELTSVSHENHFYAFYFKRELLPEKVAAHRARLRNIKAIRAEKESKQYLKILAAEKEKLRLEKLYARQVDITNKELQQEVTLEKEAAQAAPKPH